MVEKKVLTIAALLGIIAGRIVLAFRKGYSSGEPIERSRTMIMLNILARQNEIMMNHLTTTQSKMVSELLNPSESSDDKSDMHEISCRNDHIEVVRSLMDDVAEAMVRDIAMWANGALGSYDLSLNKVTLESDKASDVGRTHDVVLVFHVRGTGDNALRFQAEASRKLRELTMQTDAPSVRVLRTDVRWS
jgi:hypothetical protein